MNYRKKPVVIEAYQTDVEVDIETLEGTMHASVGDYIITGVNGEKYPCKPDIFEKTYEPVIYDAPKDSDNLISYGPGDRGPAGEPGVKKAMLSQPMNGKSDEEIVATRNRAIDRLKELGYDIVNTLFTDEWYSKEKMEERGVVQIPLCFLAKSLENMSLCHAVYFCAGWESARGCRIEHDAAKVYGLDIIYEESKA